MYCLFCIVYRSQVRAYFERWCAFVDRAYSDRKATRRAVLLWPAERSWNTLDPTACLNVSQPGRSLFVMRAAYGSVCCVQGARGARARVARVDAAHVGERRHVLCVCVCVCVCV